MPAAAFRNSPRPGLVTNAHFRILTGSEFMARTSLRGGCWETGDLVPLDVGARNSFPKGGAKKKRAAARLSHALGWNWNYGCALLESSRFFT